MVVSKRVVAGIAGMMITTQAMVAAWAVWLSKQSSHFKNEKPRFGGSSPVCGTSARQNDTRRLCKAAGRKPATLSPDSNQLRY